MKLIRFGQTRDEKSEKVMKNGKKVDVSSFGEDYEDNVSSEADIKLLLTEYADPGHQKLNKKIKMIKKYKSKRRSIPGSYSILLLLILLTLFAFSCSNDTVFYVSNMGNDNNLGTIKMPFATLDKAINTAQQLREEGADKQITVFLREGVYYQEKGITIKSEIKGMKKLPLTISAYDGEEVVLSGGKSIPLDRVVDVEDKEIRARFSTDAQDKIKQIDLMALGISDYGEIRNVGFSTPYGIAWAEIFVNDRPMRLARWPNAGMIPVARVFEAGSVPRDGDFSGRGGVMGYDSLRIDTWASEKDAWISGYFKYSWGDDMLKIASIDTLKKTITTALPAFYGFASGQPYHRWYGVNIMVELDEPGEYYIDRETGILYFIPGEEEIESLEFSMLEEPFITLQGTSGVTISEIIFECSRGLGIAMDNTRNTRIEGCTFRNLGSLGITVGKGIEPFTERHHEGTGQPKSGIVGSLQQHLYANTTFNREGGQNNLITGCEFYQLGAGGVSIGGGNRLTLDEGNNVIENCVIHHLNRIERSYRPAIHLTGVGNSVRHCEVYNVANQAVLMHGNNHMIEYNYFHEVVLEAEDAGAIYYGRDPSERGNVIRYNYFENIPDQGLTMAVYADDGACGLTITGNVFYRAGERVFMLGGGSDHTITNNIFIGSKYGIHVDNRLQNWAGSTLELIKLRLQEVGYDKLPYSKQYPQLSSYFSTEGRLLGTPERNVAKDNVFVDINQVILYVGKEKGGYSKAKWIDIKEGNLEITYDKVGFVDWENRDFSLNPNSVIYKQLPGFQEIPFHEIGLFRTRKK